MRILESIIKTELVVTVWELERSIELKLLICDLSRSGCSMLHRSRETALQTFSRCVIV